MIAALGAEIAAAFEMGDVTAARAAIEAIRALVDTPIGKVIDVAAARKRNAGGQ